MKNKAIVIEVDEGLVLRQLTRVDAVAYFGLVDSDRPHLSQFGDVTAQKYKTLRDVQNSIVEPENNPPKLRFGIWDLNVFVGSINLTPQKNNAVKLGFWVGSRFQGKRYVSRSTRRLVQYAFKVLKCKAVVADVAKGNVTSIRIFKRCGFIEIPGKSDEKELFFQINNLLL